VAAQAFSATRASRRASQHKDDVDADALFLAVVDGPEVDDLLEVAPAALKRQAGILV